MVAGETIFIVGPTGAGKSTFLDRFFRKTLSGNLRKHCFVSRVNCLDFSGQEDSALHWLTETLISSIESQMYDGGSPSFKELQGLYYSEYQRRAQGVNAHLYKRDKEAFKERFGNYLSQTVETDREGYLKRMLTDVVKNRKKLPIFVIDNTDEFSLKNKQSLFQFSQAMARHAKHCLLVFPVTDKSAWSFSKTDIFGIYQSKSFFLPTPSPREVFRKRIAFLKKKLPLEQVEDQHRNYFTGHGIPISIKNLGRFAEILENVFVGHDFTSKTIGELTNYNIRRTLLLSQRVITSSVFNIEDLLKSYLLERPVAPNYAKFINALIKGDYSAFKPGDKHEIYPVFQVDANIRQSPLLAMRILALLESARHGAKTLDEKHQSVQSIIQYFDATGCPESAVSCSLLSLFEARLVEPYDPSVRDLSHEQQLAISYSGRAHFRLATQNDVFIEQMALTTSILNEDVASKIRGIYKSKNSCPDRMSAIRRMFLDYLLEEDRLYISVPERSGQHDCQIELIELLKKATSESVARDEFRYGVFTTGVIATVDWFDQEKGYGFTDVPEIDERVFLHIKKLKEAGIDHVNDGDDLLCDIARNGKGLSVDKVHDIQTDPSEIETVYCSVIKLLPDRRYGFVRVDKGSREAFFHYSAIPKSKRELLSVGLKLRVELRPDKKGCGLQVRKVLMPE